MRCTYASTAPALLLGRAAGHDRVLRRAGWAPTVTKDLVTYTPPSTATADEIEATKAAARAIRIRDGWASERA